MGHEEADSATDQPDIGGHLSPFSIAYYGSTFQMAWASWMSASLAVA